MNIIIQEVTRRFLYNGVTLPDIQGLDVRAVRDTYSLQFPELLTADIVEGDVVNGQQEITFKRAVGTKG